MSRAVTELQDTSAACEIERGQKSTGVLRKAPQRRIFQNLACSRSVSLECFWEPSLTQALTLHCSLLHLTPQCLQLQTPCSHSTSACWGGGSPNTASTFLLHSLWCSLQAMGTQSYCNIPVVADFLCQERFASLLWKLMWSLPYHL